MSYDREEIRLQILLILAVQPAYTANQVHLGRQLALHGYSIPRDTLIVELAWLEEMAEAIVDRDVDGVHIATLSDDGAEHLTGTRIIPKIRRPSPGEIAQCQPLLK